MTNIINHNTDHAFGNSVHNLLCNKDLYTLSDRVVEVSKQIAEIKESTYNDVHLYAANEWLGGTDKGTLESLLVKSDGMYKLYNRVTVEGGDVKKLYLVEVIPVNSVYWSTALKEIVVEHHLRFTSGDPLHTILFNKPESLNVTLNILPYALAEQLTKFLEKVIVPHVWALVPFNELIEDADAVLMHTDADEDDLNNTPPAITSMQVYLLGNTPCAVGSYIVVTSEEAQNFAVYKVVADADGKSLSTVNRFIGSASDEAWLGAHLNSL